MDGQGEGVLRGSEGVFASAPRTPTRILIILKVYSYTVYDMLNWLNFIHSGSYHPHEGMPNIVFKPDNFDICIKCRV